MFWVDFETRSPVDLITRGVYAYVKQAEVICMSYAFDDEEVRTWRPGEPFPDIGRAQIRAHNAAFERLVFWHVLDMPIPLERFYCTAAQARANCMPGSLEDVGRFSGAAMKKDHRGAVLVRKFCIPPYSEDDPAELIEYCEQDVRAMRAVSQAMRQLTPEELADYHVSERINDRGVRLDVELALAAIKYADVEGVEIQRRVSEVTNQEVVSVRSPKMREWVLARVTPEQRELMIVKDKWSIDKSVRANLLACDDLAPEVREVVQSADDLWASSVAKFARLAALADQHDRRVRGAFVFAGGAATGRFASYGAQVHNFTRKVAKDPEAVRHAMVRGHALVPTYGARVTDVLRGMLRPALLPAEGCVFIVADWSSIEARVTPWLAGVTGEAKLDVFRSGRDPYIVNAAGAFRVPYEEVTDAQRQLGKVMELSCGFAGGAGAFAAMGRAYGTVLPEAEAKRMVVAWRRVNAWAPPFWTALEQAYLRAMRNPGHEFDAGRVTYLFDGQHLWYVLPSGRVLCYPFARLEEDGVSYAKASWKPKADAVEWPRGRLWCGLACIAKGTPVLTHRGWIPIEKVLSTDLVWDGEQWVEHDGVAHQGVRRVSLVFGVDMTADHLVLTSEGWVCAGKAEGHTRAACRIPNGYAVDRPDDAVVPAVERRDGASLDFEAGRCSEVFDLINCGPRRRFVVMGEDGKPLIVHNCENATQAVAADILRAALRRLPDVVLHVHDEIVQEVPTGRADRQALVDVMTTPPKWATGLPLACSAKVMTRYGK